MFYPCCSHVLSLQFSSTQLVNNSMKNLLSYCGLIDARITVSGKDLPVHYEKQFLKYQTKCEE